jgi:predicted transcriptional regulator
MPNRAGLPTFPKKAVFALGHKQTWSIINILQQEKQLSYTELKAKTNMQKGSLNHHLNKLMDTGLVDNFSQDIISGPYKSFYRNSNFKPA